DALPIFELRHDLVDLALFLQLELFLGALLAVQASRKDSRLIDFRNHRVERPGLDRNELLDLLFALDNQPDRDRLNPASTQALADLLPQQWAQLVSDEAVDHAARLLRIHEILVDRPQRV